MNLQKMSKEYFYTAKEVATVLGVNPQRFREQAYSDPKKLGFKVCVVGNTVLVPKHDFDEFCKGKEQDEDFKTIEESPLVER